MYILQIFHSYFNRIVYVKDYYNACQNKASLSMKKISKLEKTVNIINGMIWIVSLCLIYLF